MVFSIYAQDNEFALATGPNVNSGGDRSDFDYPPTSSSDLVITTNEGDTDPRLFEVGDTYDLSFRGQNGTRTIEDAVVVRSDGDGGPGGFGIIVFEGVDSNGDITEVIWTPGMDLEQWYFDNFSGGVPPQFYTTDQNAAYTHDFVCFAAETRVATPDGARRVVDMRAGDLVVTLDRGAQPVRWVGAQSVQGTGPNAPVEIALGALGNTAPLRLSQQHLVLWRSAMAELLFAAEEVLVPIRALIDGRNVRLRPCRQVTYVHLMLDRHELLLAEGAPCESLLTVPPWVPGVEVPPISPQRTARPVLTYREARFVTGAGDTGISRPAVVL